MKPLFTAAIAGVNYLLHPEILGMIQEDIKPDAVLPVTLISTEELNSPNLDDFLKGLELFDDVYSSEFAFALVEKPGANETKQSTSDRRAAVAGKQTYTVQVTGTPDDAARSSPFSDLPTGPYILHGKELHQAYRIYEDELGAFSAGIVSEKHDTFDKFLDLGDALTNGTYRPIAVPSRLYFPGPSIKKPLSGLRYSVPEDFDLGGLPTTLSSQNWTSLHPDGVSKHAAYVQLLLDEGAIIVGKTKDGQFAAGTSWVDVTAPINPRGDGKQPVGGAAAGAGSALSNYTWLDNSIGQGALDGAVPQGAAYGLFTLRATAGTASQKGVRTSSPKFQSTGLFSRSLEDLVHLTAPSFKLSWKATARPKRIIYPTDFSSLLSDKQNLLMDEFVAAWEKILNVKANNISLAETWAKNPPKEARGQTLNDYLGNATYDAFDYDFYHNYDEFRSAFKTKFAQEPYTEPNVAEKWSIGAKTDGKAAAKKLELFSAWFAENVAPTTSDASDKAAILIPVLGQNSIKSGSSNSLHPDILAPVLGAPQMSAPFAQIAIDGDKDAYVPFSAGVIGAKGDDLMLVQTMKRTFDMAGWRIRVDPGRSTYPPGDNSRDDPYHGLNDLNLRWISAQNWTYTSNPISGLSQDQSQSTWLIFDGLDTYSTIKLCDKIVATTDNQFKQWSFDVTSVLSNCDSEPVLSINFGAVPTIINKLNASGIETWPPEVVYPFEYPNRQWVRKEQSDFGWDWGPAFVPTGPWRDGRIVQLKDGEAHSLNTNIDIYRKGQLNNFAADQGQPWVVNASLDFVGSLPRHHSMHAVITDADDDSKILYSGKLENVTRSNSTITGSAIIDADKPQLWWPSGMGKQPLYSITVSVSANGTGEPALVSRRRVGFRTIFLSTGNVTDEQIARGYQPGNNWHFQINGHEFYAKGANMIPPNAFWPRVTAGRMKRMFDSVEAQNFNMLRIWSSGAYLPDFIYDLADERGILLWSEFEFSDSLYPDYPDFVQSVSDEISYNVRRINHHPSLACWAGGNEFENLLLPQAQAVDPDRYPYYLGQYEHLFITVMFTILAENSRSISYTPSSANNGWTKIDFSLPVPMVERYNNKTEGDLYSNTDYYNYESAVSFDFHRYPVGRFAVEFGFTSMPSLATWKEALDPEDLHFNSSVITLRNHHYPPGGLQTNYTKGAMGLAEMTLAVERYYPSPSKDDSVANFGAWCHATQLFQADFYKSQIQFYRRGSAMPERQMGSLYWQLNDIWQAPTWAALEYSGRWKALPYMARHVYKNVIAAPFFDRASGDLEFWVTSDLWESVSGSLSLSWVDLEGKSIVDNAGMPRIVNFTVPAINSTNVFKTNIANFRLPDQNNAILLMSLQAEGHLPNDKSTTRFTHRDHFLPVWPKDAKFADPGLKLSRVNSTGGFVIEATKAVSLYTWLTHPEEVLGFFDDNLFVLVPGEKKHVQFLLQEGTPGDGWMDKVTVDSLWDLTTRN
ncbi:beta-mannosidase precursor [Cordyceps javanica]|uniref:Beta-mannosidase A n=1 Tax=Cordyceps javanica TaxID=43265 RepID=A0A545UQQ8_9HYPO|nr:beta-mannosidase precursor [Cordyceps javanica]